MITRELKIEWLKNLRSKQYKQGMGFLLRNYPEHPEYCCLGVLADTCGAERVGDGYVVVSFIDDPDERDYGNSAYFGKSVGLTDRQIGTLQRKNDRGENFNMIADYIEKCIGPKL